MLKSLDETLDLLYGFLKDWYYWNATRNTAERPKEYAKRKLAIHYHFGVRPGYRGNPQPQEFCARFNRLSRAQLRNDFYMAIDRGQPNATHSHVDRGEGNDQVFILNVDIIDYPKRGTVRVFPSEVWLRPSDACLLHSFGEILQMFGHDNFKQTTASLDWEVKTLGIREGRLAMLRNLPQELVERGTKLIGYFTNNNAPFLWGIRQDCPRNEDEFAEASCPVHATLTNIFTGIFLPECVSSYLEGFQVIDCPLNLETRAIERMHAVNSTQQPATQSRPDSNAS